MSDDLRYPIGKWNRPTSISEADRAQWLDQIAAMPAALRKAVEGLSEAQLDTPYREGGWTPRQIVHHLADSHMNAVVRVKLALTEVEPTVKPYDQGEWAKLADSTKASMMHSLNILEALHARWVLLARSLKSDDFSRTFMHPEQKRLIPIGELLSTYAWHGQHHTAQITNLRSRKGW